jgi:hypothetical protein
MPVVDDDDAPRERLGYLDITWRGTTRLRWQVRTRLLELHQEGVLEAGELSPEAVGALDSGGIDLQEGVELLGGLEWRVKAAQAQEGDGRPVDWKSRLLLELLHGQVLPCSLHCHHCMVLTAARPVKLSTPRAAAVNRTRGSAACSSTTCASSYHRSNIVHSHNMCSYRVLPNVKVTPQAAGALMQSHCSLHMPNAACPLHPGNLRAHSGHTPHPVGRHRARARVCGKVERPVRMCQLCIGAAVFTIRRAAKHPAD